MSTKKKAATSAKIVAAKTKSKTSWNEAYLEILSNLDWKLRLAEHCAFKIWEANRKSEDLANWLQAQQQLRITVALLGKLSGAEVEAAQ